MKQLILCAALFSLQGIAAQPAHFTQVIDSSNPALNFTNTAAAYKGVAWIDLDDDNLPDLFVCQRFLFKNLGNGTFQQLTDVPGAPGGQIASGCSWGDLNNDGAPDLITASIKSALQYNNGDNTFSIQSALLPSLDTYTGWDVALADADNNGLLDPIFVHASGGFIPAPDLPCKLYLQNPVGVFTPVEGYAFATELRPYTIPVWADYDLDGDQDLFIGTGPAGSLGPDFCFKNMLKETGSFSLQRLTAAPFDEQEDGQTYNFPDYDNDGYLDIMLTNYGGSKTKLWHNDHGSYTPVSAPFTQSASQNLANCWGDFNNDGWVDMLLTRDGYQGVLLYQNNGNGTFTSVQCTPYAASNISGIAVADYDNDGDLDIYTNGAGEGRTLLRNDLAAGKHWASFTLQGVQSNRSGIGTVVRVKSMMNGNPVWQTRMVSAHNSFQSQNDLRQHFGLNDATVLDSVEIRWPSGITQVFTNLVSDNFYKIVENQNVTVISSVEPRANAVLEIMPNPASEYFRIKLGPEQNGEQSSAILFDMNGKNIPVDTVSDTGFLTVKPREGIPAGAYMIRIRFTNGVVATGKIVKD